MSLTCLLDGNAVVAPMRVTTALPVGRWGPLGSKPEGYGQYSGGPQHLHSKMHSLRMNAGCLVAAVAEYLMPPIRMYGLHARP